MHAHHFSKGLKFRVLENSDLETSDLEISDPLKIDWDFKRSSTWMIIIVLCWQSIFDGGNLIFDIGITPK